jgi:hypothetical protein
LSDDHNEAILDTLPEIELRALVDRFELVSLIAHDPPRDRYLRHAATIERALEEEYKRHGIPSCMVRELVAGVIIHSKEFLEHVAIKDGRKIWEKKKKMRALATATAGAVLAARIEESGA